jgi:hypothetical protein
VLSHNKLATPKFSGPTCVDVRPFSVVETQSYASDACNPQLTVRESEVPFVRVERGVKRFKVSWRCVIFGSNSLEWTLSLSRREWSDNAWVPSLVITSEERDLTLETL